ncbi:MAG: alpha/beta hydrolase [Mycobacterium sp.]|uniref:alpha/beta hydrolase n=1 Tax=Mycobacterium sp. TaxID=1785 RepID=UPI003CC536D0
MPSTDFHPDLRRIARFAPRTLVGPRTLPLLRALMKLQSRRTPADVEVLTLSSGTRVRVYRAAGSTDVAPALLWIHGGGYVMGAAQHDDGLCRRFSSRLGITVASVEYRLAPEHPYPAALDDCYSALSWLTTAPAVDPARVAIGGASAGGGLAAALALRTRDRGEIELALQLLVYPMLDDRSPGSAPRHDYRFWSPRSNRFGWAAYLGATDPQVAVPARRDDLTGLPPAWIGVGTCDLFHDQDLAYAERLRSAGVPCHVEVIPGAFHGFDYVASRARVSQNFFAAQCAGLRAALGPPG